MIDLCKVCPVKNSSAQMMRELSAKQENCTNQYCQSGLRLTPHQVHRQRIECVAATSRP